eukprot:364896-Chlamydomonas_euryale.AAC.12
MPGLDRIGGFGMFVHPDLCAATCEKCAVLSYKGLGEPLCFFAFGPSATTAFYLAMLPRALVAGKPEPLPPDRGRHRRGQAVATGAPRHCARDARAHSGEHGSICAAGRWVRGRAARLPAAACGATSGRGAVGAHGAVDAALCVGQPRRACADCAPQDLCDQATYGVWDEPGSGPLGQPAAGLSPDTT